MSFQTTWLPPRCLKGRMGFVKSVLLKIRMGIQMDEEFCNLSITSQMPKLCLCRAYLFEKTCYQANTNRFSNYKSFDHLDLLCICVKFDITVPAISDFDHILVFLYSCVKNKFDHLCCCD